MLKVMLQAPEMFNEWLCDNIGIRDSYSRGWKKYRGDNQCQLVSRIHDSIHDLHFAGTATEQDEGFNRVYNNRDTDEESRWFPEVLEGRPDKLYWILKLYPHEKQADRVWQIILLWHETGRSTSTLEDLENHQAWVVRIEGDESCGGTNDGVYLFSM